MNNEYKCENCNGVFKKGWTDEEAEKESLETFGITKDQGAVVCDDCYNEIMYERAKSMKPSDLFEGPDSSLAKTFREAVKEQGGMEKVKLEHCLACNQMTNHRGSRCMKCNKELRGMCACGKPEVESIGKEVLKEYDKTFRDLAGK